MEIDAILWDYDGTLVNSVPKNIGITKQILSVVAPRLSGDNLPQALRSEKAYHIANHQAKNWQILYREYYGLTEDEMIEAGTMWSEYQLKSSIPVQLFASIKYTLNQIQSPQGICSQNSSENINQVLENNNLAHKINSIVGYDDIPGNAQKPSPVGGIICLKKIFKTIIDKKIIYVGDHEGDVEFARNIKKKLSRNSQVISIVAKYSGADTSLWTSKPDFEIEKPTDLLTIINC